MRLLKRKPWAPLLAVAAALFLAMGVATESAQAQEPPPHVDLSLSLRHGLGVRGEAGKWIFELTNHSAGRHVHSGQVKITIAPYIGGTVVIPEYNSQYRDPDLDDFDRATGIWRFSNLAPGQTKDLQFIAELRNHPPGAGGLLIGRGEIISSVPEEDPMFLHNNATREAWKFWISPGRAAEGNGVVEMQVSDRSPAAGDTVDFTVKFWNEASLYGSFYEHHDMYDVRVKVDASPGLELVSASPPTGTFGSGGSAIQVTTSFDRSTGIWNLGNVDAVGGVTYIDMPVSARYTGAAPLEEACLTAELVNVVPPEAPDPVYQRDNKVTVCLGDDPTVLIREGDLTLIDFYPCVGATAFPCNDQDTLEVMVAPINRDIMRQAGLGIDRSDVFVSAFGWATVLQQEDIVFQVGDT